MLQAKYTCHIIFHNRNIKIIKSGVQFLRGGGVFFADCKKVFASYSEVFMLNINKGKE